MGREGEGGGRGEGDEYDVRLIRDKQHAQTIDVPREKYIGQGLALRLVLSASTFAKASELTLNRAGVGTPARSRYGLCGSHVSNVTPFGGSAYHS